MKRRRLGRPVDPKVREAARAMMDDLVKETAERRAKRSTGYREQSLRIHGTVCAKCGRDFEGKDLRLLTVHHKDGNHQHNPPDGGNWENLCVYCHDDEHSRELLADYLTQRPSLSPPPSEDGAESDEDESDEIEDD